MKKLNNRCNDKVTRLSWSNQVDRESYNPDMYQTRTSDRLRRRKEERDLEKFYNTLSNHMNREWWYCISSEDKKRTRRIWDNKKNEFTDVNHFCQWVKSEVKIDKSLYRDMMINKLLK